MSSKDAEPRGGDPVHAGERPEPPRCRTCGRRIEEHGGTFPFCSRRCRDVDLGNWFSGSYSISRDIKDSDLETVD